MSGVRKEIAETVANLATESYEAGWKACLESLRGKELSFHATVPTRSMAVGDKHLFTLLYAHIGAQEGFIEIQAEQIQALKLKIKELESKLDKTNYD